tara:strand:- start:2766 stop:5279 length:2514 start_codon:yes stop_codon:yes gene_type:complete
MSVFIQEVLGLLTNGKRKDSLKLKSDYIELGRLKDSSLNTGSSYSPKMDPYVMRLDDFVAALPGGTDTTYLLQSAQSGDNVAITLNASAGTDSVLTLRPGTNVTLSDNGSGQITINSTAGGAGTVTSVGLVVPTGFTVINSPITASGVMTIEGAGTVAQYIDGTGGLTTFPTIPAVPFTSLTTNGSGAATLASGVLNVPTPDLITGSGSAKQMAMWTATKELSDAAPVAMIQNGAPGATAVLTIGTDDTETVIVESTISLQGGVKDEVSSLGTSGMVLTSTGSKARWQTIPAAGVTSIVAGTNVTISPVAGTGAVTINATASGSGTVTTVSSTTAGDALDVAVTNASTTPALAFTFAGATTEYINGEGNLITFPASSAGTVTSVASLTLGTSGTDLTSTVANGTTAAVITLNVPTASATNRGALSAADWTTFNSKGNGTVTLVASTFAGTAFTSTVTNASTAPAIAITANGANTDYVNGAGDFIALSTLPATNASGADTQVQYNNSGAFGAGSFFTTNKTSKVDIIYELGLVGDGTNQGLLKLYCEAGTPHYVGLKGPLHSGGSSYTLQLPNTLPNVANQILESNAAGTLSWVNTPVGSVTSVGLTMPAAFAVASSPITSSGTITVSGAGATTQYIDGTGALQTFPTIPAAYTGWNLTGDLGSAQTITTGNTALIAGGVGLTSTASATDTLTINLDNTAVTPGTYENPSIVVDAQGRITSAASGTGVVYLSYVATWTDLKGTGIVVTEMSNDTGLTFAWANDSAGGYTITPSAVLGGYKSAWVMVNGSGGTRENRSEVFFVEVVGGKVSLENVRQDFIRSNVSVNAGNIEIRYYKAE